MSSLRVRHVLGANSAKYTRRYHLDSEELDQGIPLKPLEAMQSVPADLEVIQTGRPQTERERFQERHHSMIYQSYFDAAVGERRAAARALICWGRHAVSRAEQMSDSRSRT